MRARPNFKPKGSFGRAWKGYATDLEKENKKLKDKLDTTKPEKPISTPNSSLVNAVLDSYQQKIKELKDVLHKARTELADSGDWGTGADPRVKLVKEIEQALK